MAQQPLDMGAWTVADDAIRNRYEQIATRLGFAPLPQFSLVPRATLNGGFSVNANTIGEHRRNADGTFSIKIADDLDHPAEIDFVLVHELAHHALHRAGYHGPGHAWPMLAIERILLHKLGWDINSIIEDAQHSWPTFIFWRTWLRNVDHAFALYNEAAQDEALIARPAQQIGRWVLTRPPEHEPKYFQWEIGAKLREMHHAFIADKRSLLFVLQWTIRGLLLGGFGIALLGSETGVNSLVMVGVGALTGGLLLAALAGGVIFVWQKCCSAGRSVRKVVQVVADKLQ